MAAIITHVSTKLVLTLDAGDAGGKRTKKTVTISGLREDISGDAVLEAVNALEKLLTHPVADVKLHTVSVIERRDEYEEEAETAAAKGPSPDARPAARAFVFAGPANGLLPQNNDFPGGISRPVQPMHNIFPRAGRLRPYPAGAPARASPCVIYPHALWEFS